MKSKEEIMMNYCSDNGLLSISMGKHILAAMDDYAAEILTEYTTFLLNHGYTDTDILGKPPELSALNRFLLTTKK